MTKGKNYNRIVFLTTLSVYLGLVLAGATPQVMAYAALTRNFDIQNEIEVKDDLDNKPENEDIESFFELGLDKAVADFVADLRRLKQQGKYKSSYKKNLTTSCSHTLCSEDAADASLGELLDDSKIAEALWKLHLKIDIGAGGTFYKYLYDEFVDEFRKDKNTGCKEINTKLVFNQKELNINFEFSKQAAQKASVFIENLNRAFVIKSAEAKDLLTKQVYENTKAILENNQVFIVTRLPRAGIDSLLK
jgi:hypothetical protein